MKIKVVNSSDLKLFGWVAQEHEPGPVVHDYTAHLENGKIVVRDSNRNEIQVRYAGASDNRTLYAYVDGVGFIGGWQWPHPPQKFLALIDSINDGILYRRIEDLPKR